MQPAPGEAIRSAEGIFERPGMPRLHHRSWRPPQPRASLLLVHGFGEHSGRYDEFARALAGAGLAVVAPDLRGFGRSDGPRAFVSTWREYTDDLVDFVENGPLASLPRPLALLGHSMGGLIAFDLVESGAIPFAAVVATSPLLGVAIRIPAWKEALGRAASRLVPRLALPSGVGPELLTHDPARIAEYVADPLIHQRATARWYTEMTLALARVLAGADRVRIPTLVVHAGADAVTDPEASRRFVERLGTGDREFRLREGEYHEILNELRRGELYDEIRDWLLARLEPPVAGPPA